VQNIVSFIGLFCKRDPPHILHASILHASFLHQSIYVTQLILLRDKTLSAKEPYYCTHISRRDKTHSHEQEFSDRRRVCTMISGSFVERVLSRRRTSRNSVTGGVCVTRLIHRCDITHPSMWHDSSIYVTWLIHLCDTTHSSMWHDSSINTMRLIHPCNMTHPSILHDTSMYVTRPMHTSRNSVQDGDGTTSLCTHTPISSSIFNSLPLRYIYVLLYSCYCTHMSRRVVRYVREYTYAHFEVSILNSSRLRYIHVLFYS